MSHDDPRATGFVLGELDAPDASAFREVLERDPEAIERIEELREVAALMQESLQEPSPLELAPDQRTAILAGASQPRTPRISSRPWTYAAAAVVVVGAGVAAAIWTRDSSTIASRPPDNTAGPARLALDSPTNQQIGMRNALVASVDTAREPTPVRRPIVMLDRSGRLVREIAPTDVYYSFRLSPDGRYIAVDQESESGQRDIWVRDLSDDSVRRLTADGGTLPIWSMDGRLVFSSPAGDKTYRINRDGSGPRVTVTEGVRQSPLSVSPDGRMLVWQKQDPATGWDLWISPLSGEAPRPVSQSPSAEQHASFSPDGRWIAYTSDESGRPEIYVRGIGNSAKYLVSISGATASRWRRDGRELFYVAPGGQLMSVEIASKDDTFSVGTPRLLFEIPAPLAAEFEVTRDGQRFIVFGRSSGQ